MSQSRRVRSQSWQRSMGPGDLSFPWGHTACVLHTLVPFAPGNQGYGPGALDKGMSEWAEAVHTVHSNPSLLTYGLLSTVLVTWGQLQSQSRPPSSL